MLPDASFTADVVLVAPREFEITRAQRTYREKNFTTFTELLSVNAFQTESIKRINEALGLEALASYLRAADVSVATINCNVAPHTPADVVRKIVGSRAKVVGISLIYRPQVAFAIELLEALRNVHGVHVCMGGALASFMPRELLSKLTRLDAVIYGEAEETFRDYCLAILGNDRLRRGSGAGTPAAMRVDQPILGPNDLLRMVTSTEACSNQSGWRALPGIAYRDGNVVIVNPAAPALDLRRILAPARDTLTYLSASRWPTRIASIYTSRGCMAKCTFCTGKDAYNVERTRTYRFRDPVDVVDEIQTLHEAFDVHFVYINDDNFLGYGPVSSERVRIFAETLIERKLGIQFATECRVDALDRDLLLLLKAAGMRQVLLGIESGSASTLLRWRKGATVAQNRAAVEAIHEAGLALEPGFILVDAHTSREELRENVSFLRETGLYRTPVPTYLINRLSVYPGTEIEQMLVADGTIEPSPIRYGGAVVNDPAAVIQYFQRMEYVCRDARTEIVWRVLRSTLEPIEMFLEDGLPAITSALIDSRNNAPSLEDRAETSALIRRVGAWRRGLGQLILDLLDECVRSYDADGSAAQYRSLRRTLTAVCARYSQQTLSGSMQDFSKRVIDLRRRLTRVDVAVVIPTAGKWPRLRRTLASLGRQQGIADLRWEIVLVLDGVDPPGNLPLACEGVPLRLVRLPERRGRGGARNTGIAATHAEIVVLVDDDMVVSRDFVASHVAQQRAQASLCRGPVREVPLLACVDDLDALTPAPSCADRARLALLLARAARVIAAVDDADAAWEEVGSESRIEHDGTAANVRGLMSSAWVAFAGANLSAPRRWFLEAPFDERPGARWGLEDTALALKWSLAGRHLSLVPRARALHLSHDRHGWRDDLRANVACLDFLSTDAAWTVVAYLEGRVNISILDGALAPYFSSARVDVAPAV